MNEVETQQAAPINPFASPNTPALPPPERPADAHRVKVVAVAKRVFDSGSTAIALALESIDTGININYNLWPPKGYVEDVTVDPNSLPTGTQYTDAEGKVRTKGDQRTQYARTISNSKGNADLDLLLSYAAAQGVDISGVAFDDFDGVCASLNAVLAGVEFIIERKPQRDNPDFLEVGGHKSIAQVTDGKYLASLQKRRITPKWM